ncbi:trypsin-like peptidase domain-containing protein [Flocculibacter collagenilyticus]|uniref:trypsin-like peptidase domain-containing protein n=1 Tax=Flocculibacter collagenilyticus TaxID=2744479 RepID=UPI0018F34441|nr:trypsin-like peptidase domain-containing protein [Flocculibacter collagenilyticus]
MRKTLLFLLQSISYGLAIAFLVIIFFPSLRGDLNLNSVIFKSSTQHPPAVSYSAAVRSASPAVVYIYSESFTKDPRYLSQQSRSVELGSGVLMNSDGYILTAYHVIDNADQIAVALQDGRRLEAELVGSDKLTDLALLKIDTDNLPVIPQDPKINPQVGDVVLAIGTPLNLGQTITQGIISATGKKGITGSSHADFLQMDAAINPGSSGGALVNSNGLLVGINAANTNNFQARFNIDVQGIFFAVPYHVAIKVMNKIIEHGRVIRGYLGITGVSINSAGAEVSSTAELVAGILVGSLDPLGPAWNAGLKRGDVLLAIEETRLTNIQEALDIVADTLPGTTLNFTIARDGKKFKVPVLITELE